MTDAPSTTSPAGGWTTAFADKSDRRFDDAFADDIVLEAAVLYEPVRGREQVSAVMAVASKIYESLTFTARATAEHNTFLSWEATAFDGVVLDGVTVLTSDDDGRIVRAAIHHRPLGAALQFSDELRRRLDGVVPERHFHRLEA